MAVLWRMAVCCADDTVSNAAISLLIEVHHRIPEYKFKNCDIIRGHILKMSFRQLSGAMQTLRAGDKEKIKSDERTLNANPMLSSESSAINSAKDSLPTSVNHSGTTTPNIDRDKDNDRHPSNSITQRWGKKSEIPQGSGKIIIQPSGPMDEWFDDGDIIPDSREIARVVARLIMLLLLYIQRFDQSPAQLITLQILAGCYTILYYIVLHYIMQNNITSYYIILYYVLLYHII